MTASKLENKENQGDRDAKGRSEDHGSEVPAAELCRALQIWRASPKDDGRTYTGKVFIEIAGGKLRAIATDGMMLARYEAVVEHGDAAVSFVLGSGAANDVIKALRKIQDEQACVAYSQSTYSIVFAVIGKMQITHVTYDVECLPHEKVVPKKSQGHLERDKTAMLLDPLLLDRAVQIVKAVFPAQRKEKGGELVSESVELHVFEALEPILLCCGDESGSGGYLEIVIMPRRG